MTADVSDVAGNPATQATHSLAVDETAPTITISQIAGDDILNALEAQSPLAISGTTSGVDDGQHVTVSLNGHSYDAVVTSNAWTATVPAAALTHIALADGSYQVTADVSDVAGNPATQATHSLAVDETAPTITISQIAGDDILNALEAQSPLAISGTTSGVDDGQHVTVSLNGHSYDAVVTSNAWTATVPAAALTHIALADGSYQVTADVSDVAGNPATQATHSLAVDETAPTISSEAITSATGIQNSYLNAGDVVSVTVALSESVTVTGTPQLALNIGGTTVQANYSSGSGSSSLVFTYTTQSGQADTNGISVDANALSLNSGTIKDAAGNSATLTATSVTDNASYKVDTTAPTIAITSPIAGDNTVNKTEAAAGFTISGTASDGGSGVNGRVATITIVDGSNNVKDTYTSTVSSGVWSVNVSATDAQALADGGYTVKANVADAAGNAATTATQAISVDESAPTVSSEAITSATGIQNSYLNAGDVVSVTVALSESVTVTGTPQLALNIGGTTVQANYSSGSGSSSLVFTYTTQSGQTDTNGISIDANALSLNGGTIKDAAGNSATLTATSVTDNASYKVDTSAPSVAKTSYSPSAKTLGGTYSDAGSGVLSITISDTEHPAANGTATLNAGNWSYTNSNLANNDHLTIVATDAAGNKTTITPQAPAGTSGNPIYLGLTNPTENYGSIEVTVSGVPAGWTLNGAVHNADGSWSIATIDVGSLSVTTPADYVGAAVLNVAETWTNTDGTTGTTIVADNVEAYAPGSPIFAWSGDDVLTGSLGNDLFVFSQPIGNDMVHSFDAAADKIDLIGYSGFQSFADVQAHMADDGNGNAVITLGDGQSITLDGIHSNALTDGNFVFDQTPVVNNAGTMTIGDGAMLPLSGTINNSGLISLDSAGSDTLLQLIQHGITLQGGGQIVLSDSDSNIISGTGADVTLTNVDNTISGAGQLGGGLLSLNNQGTIIATGTHALVIDTGANTTVNSGTLEATGSGGLMITGTLANSGLLWANGGNITIEGQVTGTGEATIGNLSKLEFGAASSTDVTFAQNAAGTLQLDDSFDFSGRVGGITNDDKIDLGDILFGAGTSAAYQADSNGSGGTLTVTDGAHNATLHLLGIFDAHNFTLVDDGAGRTVVQYGLTASGVIA
ncbi:Ig-like domain-containing protein [Mesorhizobium sp. B2-4-12]|uniref:beta strand repeat-containing protein n=1 Tax=Mesorhizobium sp. B2-4-12 TaxID=2589937 RepID=UPI0015E439AA|nr:Ig-like domain-containing protein [Mesorhizobium sp. B2-4-12]